VRQAAGSGFDAEKYQPSALSSELQQALEFLIDEDLMHQELAEMGISSSSNTLDDTISEQKIDMGFEILRQCQRIMAEGPSASNLNRNPQEELEKLTSDLFTYIPHNMGFKKMADFVINNGVRLKEEFDLLKRLRKTITTQKILKTVEATEMSAKPRHPADRLYDQLYWDMALLPQDHPMRILLTHMVEKQSNNAQNNFQNNNYGLLNAGDPQDRVNIRGSIRRFSGVKLQNVFALAKKEGVCHAKNLRESCNNLSNCTSSGTTSLLWYSAPMKDWASIVAEGLRTGGEEREENNDVGMTNSSSDHFLNMKSEFHPNSHGTEKEKAKFNGNDFLIFHETVDEALFGCKPARNMSRGFLLLCEAAPGLEKNPEQTIYNNNNQSGSTRVGKNCPQSYVTIPYHRLDELVRQDTENAKMKNPEDVEEKVKEASGVKLKSESINVKPAAEIDYDDLENAMDVEGDLFADMQHDAQVTTAEAMDITPEKPSLKGPKDPNTVPRNLSVTGGSLLAVGPNNKCSGEDTQTMLNQSTKTDNAMVPDFAWNHFYIRNEKNFVPRFLCQVEFSFEAVFNS